MNLIFFLLFCNAVGLANEISLEPSFFPTQMNTDTTTLSPTYDVTEIQTFYPSFEPTIINNSTSKNDNNIFEDNVRTIVISSTIIGTFALVVMTYKFCIRTKPTDTQHIINV